MANNDEPVLTSALKACAIDDAADSDGSGDGSASDGVDVDSEAHAPLRILQLVQVQRVRYGEAVMLMLTL